MAFFDAKSRRKCRFGFCGILPYFLFSLLYTPKRVAVFSFFFCFFCLQFAVLFVILKNLTIKAFLFVFWT